jgi:hypothetical protein
MRARIRFAAVVAAAALTTAPTASALADDGQHHGDQRRTQVLDVKASNDGPQGQPRYTLSTDTLRAGLETIRLHNKGTEPHQVQLLRLHDGKKFSDLSKVLRDPTGDVFTVADATGGSNTILPGAEQETYVNLRAGHYVALCFVSDAVSNVPHFAEGMIAQFEVTGSGTWQRPDAEGTISAFSFGFNIPADVDGHGVYRFKNLSDTDTHELTIERLAPGKIAADFLDVISGKVAGNPDDIAAPAGGGGAVAPHGVDWVRLNLASGDYVAVCFVPDPEAQNAPHAALGMVQGFSVR